ncbi:MAG: hypothetical protein M3253_07600, partial [Chloroflexota bacterium]|nr:hypothetical protein [Chloroflexota bacterium]
LRRGMTVVVITPSTDRDWIRPLTALRARGVATVVVLPDAPAFARRPLDDDDWRAGRALRHALAEHDIVPLVLVPGEPLGAQLMSVGRKAEVFGR